MADLSRHRLVRSVLGLLTVVALTMGGTAGYTVRAGETLSSIAARHGVSLSALISANRLSNPNLIRPGQQLTIPGAASGGASSSASGVHVVRSGETLMGISIRYGVKMAAIAAANGMSSLHLVYAGQRLRIPGVGAAPTGGGGAPTTARADVGQLLDATARRYGFNPAFIKAIAMQESGWNQSARSSVGAIGVMQVMPSTGEFLSRYVVGRQLNLYDTQDNITAGVAFIQYLWRLTGGDVERTLAGYYQGLASVRQHGMYPSTKSYIANILALRDRYQ